MEFPRHAQVPQGGSHDLNFGESYTRKKDSGAIQESLRKYVIQPSRFSCLMNQP